MPPGIWLWHGQGSHFGFGPAAEPVPPRTAWIVLGLLVSLLIVEFALSPAE